MDIRNKDILLLGASGLAGRNLLREITKYEPSKIYSICLEKDMENLENILIESKKKICEPIAADILSDFCSDAIEPAGSKLFSLLNKTKPHLILDTINTATFFASHAEKGKTYDVRHLLGYYTTFQNFWQNEKITELFLKLGTTGLGGMGLNLPYNHFQNSYDFIYKKAVMAGVQTTILHLFQRTPGMPLVKEIKTATAIFEPEFKYNHEHGQPTIDGGESGHYSLEEFRLLTGHGQMQFAPVEEIVRTIMDEIRGVETGKEVIKKLNESLITPDPKHLKLREKLIEKAKELYEKHRSKEVATGALGPKKITDSLHLMDFFKTGYSSINDLLNDSMDNIQNNLAEYRRDLDFTPEEIERYREHLKKYQEETKSESIESPGETLAWIYTKQGRHRVD